MTTISDVMTTDVVRINPHTPFKDIVRCMTNRDVSALPVVDGERERVVGLVSETDLLHKEEFRPDSPGDEYHAGLRTTLRRALTASGGARRKAAADTAGELMTHPVVTARPDNSVVAAARAMDRHDVRQMPVVDEHGRLVGLVSRRDLLRVFVRRDEDIARDIAAALNQAHTVIEPGRVRFTVDDGLVTLGGRLDQHSQCALVNQIAHGVEGVVGVDAHLTWTVDDLLPPRAPYFP